MERSADASGAIELTPGALMKKYAPLLLMISPLVTVAAGHLLLAWQRWEPTNAERGSLAYFLAIPARAKTFPLWEPCGSPFFSYQAKNESSQEIYTIQYQTRLTNVALARTIDHYTRLGGCKYNGAPHMPREGAEIGFGVACGDNTELKFVFPRQAAPSPSCLPVLITFTEAP
jgi:hypothetical protein